MLRVRPVVALALATALALAACSYDAYDAADPSSTLGSVEQATTVAELEAYVLEHRCTSASDDDCLEPLVAFACSSASAGYCPRRGYNWRGQTPGRIDPHMTLTYLRKLRNLAASLPDAVPQASVSWGLTAEQMLWHQVQMMLRSQAQFYATSAGTSDGTVAPLSPGDVSTSNTVDPTRFYAVAWVNTAGTAHAMAQADMALWFQSVAYSLAAAGDPAGVRYYLQLSERAFRPYGMRDADGGVRNNKRGYKCFDGRYCYWFHSFAVGEYAYPSSVLNQNLHAIRDAMEAHNQLRAWPWPLPSGLDPDHVDQLAEWARGGLFQLAYGLGNGVDASAPPNLAELEVVASDTTCDSYGYASYDFTLGGTRRCIKPMNTCHYHYHSMSVMKRILELVEIDPDFAADPYFIGAKFKLMYGRSAGDTRTCNNRSYIPPSRKVMSGVPLARLYRSSATTPFRVYCDGDPANDSDRHHDENGASIEAYRDAADWADASTELRAWYDAAYEGCTF